MRIIQFIVYLKYNIRLTASNTHGGITIINRNNESYLTKK